jgi:hypothetical protein
LYALGLLRVKVGRDPLNMLPLFKGPVGRISAIAVGSRGLRVQGVQEFISVHNQGTKVNP